MRPELVLRSTYNYHPRPEDNDRFWSVIHEGTWVGSINVRQGASDDPPYWAWAIQITLAAGARDVQTSGRADSREDAMKAFRQAFDRVIVAIGEQGWSDFVEHSRRVNSRRNKKGAATPKDDDAQV